MLLYTERLIASYLKFESGKLTHQFLMKHFIQIKSMNLKQINLFLFKKNLLRTIVFLLIMIYILFIFNFSFTVVESLFIFHGNVYRMNRLLLSLNDSGKIGKTWKTLIL